MPGSADAVDALTDADLGDPNSLVVEDQAFAIVGEWIITAEISDAAFRVYSMLLRFGGTSGCRMPSRALLGRRLHRSVDSIDRALRELVSAGIVRIEHRHDGRQYRSNRYHVRTSAPVRSAPDGCSRTSAATQERPREGGRNSAATPSRTSAATVAADPRHYPEVLTERTPPPPAPSTSGGGRRPRRRTPKETLGVELVEACRIDNLDELSSRCAAARAAVGQPSGRWSPQCLVMAIRLAVVNRGWPAASVVPALLAIAADPATRSPGRLAEAGPWWDVAPAGVAQAVEDVRDLEQRLDDLGGRRPAVQAQARAELSAEGLPVTRSTVTRRACDILDRQQAS